MNSDVWDTLSLYGVKVFGAVEFDESLLPWKTRNRKFIPENAKSILCCLFPYYSSALEGRRNISYYACVDDYHNIVGEILDKICVKLGKLYSGNKFAGFVDNSPINEVEVAVRAGLGVLGKNSLLISDVYGSYVFIGCIVTDLEVLPLSTRDMFFCVGCNRCAEVCPSGAIVDGRVDRELCLSHITQRKGEFTSHERELIRQSGIVWGCDICQQVCPMNVGKVETYIDDFRRNIEKFVDLRNVDYLVKSRAFGYRGAGVMRRNIEVCGD